MATVKIKSGDNGIVFANPLVKNGAVVDLTGATVLFMMRLVGSPQTTFSATATIVSAAAGTVSYSPGDGFPTAIGDYSQHWRVTGADTKRLTYPSNGYNKIIILDDLN